METQLKITLDDLNDRSIFINWSDKERIFLFGLLLKKMKQSAFARMINYNIPTISEIKNGKVKPSGYVYISILRMLNLERSVTDLKISSRNFKSIKIRNPVILPELIGLIHTDGHMNLNKKGNGANFYFCNQNKRLINRFKKLLLNSFICRTTEFKDKRDNTYYIYPPCIVARIIAKKIEWKSKVKIPKLLDSEIADYLRGVFDGDGTITKYNNGYGGITPRIKITSGTPSFALELQSLLQRMDIISKIRKNVSKGNRWWNVDISRQKDILSFINKVGSSHPKKMKRMRYIKRVLFAGNQVPSIQDIPYSF